MERGWFKEEPTCKYIAELSSQGYWIPEHPTISPNYWMLATRFGICLLDLWSYFGQNFIVMCLFLCFGMESLLCMSLFQKNVICFFFFGFIGIHH